MDNFIKKLIKKLPILSIDLLSMPLAWLLAFWLRENMSSVPLTIMSLAFEPLGVVFFCFFIFYYVLKGYRGIWRFVSLNDLMIILKVVTYSSLLSLFCLFQLQALDTIPRSVFPIYSLLLIGILSGTRIIVRLFAEHYSFNKDNVSQKKVLIIGAGISGECLARDTRRQPGTPYKIIGFIDDDKRKIGRQIHGIKILGDRKQIPLMASRYAVDLIFIAMPSVNSKKLREIYTICEQSQCELRVLPSINEIETSSLGFSALRRIAIEDLLGRVEVKLDKGSVGTFIREKSVMITGGGGSIGSELSKQVATLNPKQLIIIDNSEANLYHVEYNIKQRFPGLNIMPLLIDVTDMDNLNRAFADHKPQVIFHAAAFKHVPLLEDQALAAVKNNVLGTEHVIEAALTHNVEKFILVSTDKAVNPCNVMGRTKRLAELLCLRANQKSLTQFITVRFGNVLGSAGSVIPLFKRQLEQGGPITVTSPDIERFFMTIPEACTLILKASVLGGGGEIFVLDMGEPVKIKYLAEELIRLSGKKPYEDIEIKYVGLRPGEKLYEELFYKDEPLVTTDDQKIMKAVIDMKSLTELDSRLSALYRLLRESDENNLQGLLKEICSSTKKKVVSFEAA